MIATNPRRDYRFWLHRDHFTRYVVPEKTSGLEIGAFDLPLVNPSEGACEFADFRTTDQLRALAKTMPGHSADHVVDVKYNLRNGYEDIIHTYDWITASHVIEHVPDLIGWLQTLRTRLRTDGLVFLVIPDKNYTYDYYRAVTRLPDCVDSHRNHLQIPSFRQVFDHHYYTFANTPPSVFWNGGQIPPPRRNHAEALTAAERSTKEYLDAHCSVFNPNSFVHLMNEMIDAQLIQFKIEEIRPTQYSRMDFSVFLRAR